MRRQLGIIGACVLAAASATADEARLAEVLAAQPEEAQARYDARHPQETLTFFGIEPGMTVVEALPGGGWYTKILLPYLGDDGSLIGANYAQDMWPLFGFFSEERIEQMKTWTTDFVAGAEEWKGGAAPEVSAFILGSLPEEMHGKADAVLFVRALHNLSRFEDQGGFMTKALADAHTVLKPGGIVGVVQHEAPADKPDAWASGARGYLKKRTLIERMEAAGFEFVGESTVNENPNDQPGEDDIVWRLPPSLTTSREDAALREQMSAIGESHRMTLKFRKPA
ncbi:MAG: methyltransferase [Pseudomonadota bacterium]